jgi:hypothetical protein
MKNSISILSFLAVICAANLVPVNTSYAACFQQQKEEGDKEGDKKESKNQKEEKNSYPTLEIRGTNESQSFNVSLRDLDNSKETSIIAPAGFMVSPAKIPANSKSAKVTVQLLSSKIKSQGILVIRNGDTRSFLNVVGYGSSLPTKDLSSSAVYKGGSDAKFVRTANEGFKPGSKGYTVEFKVNTDEEGKEFLPYLVNDKGIGFKGYVDSKGTGVYSSTEKKGFSNPATQQQGGLGKFYNTDGQSHTYRYAVASDNRVFIFRDGLAVDTLRAQDLGPQDFFAASNGELTENLLKNADFEGEFETAADGKMATAIEGWDIVIGDRYNSEQYILPQEIDDKQDFSNHTLQMKRYMWSDGWGAAEIVQVVDVAPNENYTLQALVRGGVKEDGTLLGKIKIQEVQDRALGTSVDVTGGTWETYSLDYTTSQECKQLRIVFYLERDKWGAKITPMDVDNVKLTGRARKYVPKIGFDNESSKVDYFTYDLSGAYAPALKPEINIELKESK